jgi:hypothetical protein
MQEVRGPDLRAERVRRGLRGADVAERMRPPVSHQRIYQIESLWRVPREMVDRYLKALEARS